MLQRFARRLAAAVAWSLAWWVSPSLFAEPGSGAIRDLPDGEYQPGTALMVSIGISPPGGTVVAGLEDAPPTGWSVSSISHSGSFDTQTGKVKWGPFSPPSIPSSVSYAVAPAAGKTGERCFAGTVSFGGADQPVAGDDCLVRVPAITTAGIAAFAASILLLGARLLKIRQLDPSALDKARGEAARARKACVFCQGSAGPLRQPPVGG